MKNLYNKHSRTVQVVAAVLIACMAFTDASLYRALISDKSEYDYEITENHVLETALADGNYKDKNSDDESKISKTIVLKEGRTLFNILEILPTEKKAVIGYMIGGCEPFPDAKGVPKGDDDYLVTPQQMRTAYMDALVNAEPGSDNAKKWDINSDIGLINSKINESGTLEPFDITAVDADGYYMDVGSGKGVYADGGIVDVYKRDQNGGYLDEGGASVGEENRVKIGEDRLMYSKFYNYDPGKDYRYIFVNKGESDKSEDINVKGHRRLQYTNNEKFIRNVLGCKDLDAARDWKKTHQIEVVTKTPVSVTDTDIEDADVIIVNNGSNMDYYQYAVKVNNRASLEFDNLDKDKDVTYSTVDFDSFSKVLKIYEEVVVKEDVAFIGSRNCINGTDFDTNMHKLMGMLFFMKNNNEKDKSGNVYPGSGRDFFMNFLKRYVEEPGKDRLKKINDYKTNREWKETSTGNWGWVADPLYPDYRAPSLRHEEYFPASEGQLGIPYMHYGPRFSPGHPLVLYKDDAIVGGYFDSNGTLVPVKGKDYPSKTRQRIMRRKWGKDNTDIDQNYWNNHDQNLWNNNMFKKAGIRERKKDKNGNYIKDDFGWYYSTDNPSQWNGYNLHFDAYESMSNTTDYVFIDESNGDWVRSDKYSGYWYQMDYDNNNNNPGKEYTYKKISWNAERKSKWPWGSENGALPDWMFNSKTTLDNYDKNGSVKGTLHLWFDYYQWGPYRAVDGINGGTGSWYRNQILEGENGLLKSDAQLIRMAVDGRNCKRDEVDPTHKTESIEKDYYISMNVLNGDGFNKSGSTGKNKTIYFNEYEVERDLTDGHITAYPDIPLTVRLKSTCPIVSISVTKEGVATPFVSYSFNNYDVANGKKEITGTASGGKTVTLKSDPDPNNGAAKEKTDLNTPIYSFAGNIPGSVVKDSQFYKNRNTKLNVVMTVILPDGNNKTVEDTITIVRRDFFMLN